FRLKGSLGYTERRSATALTEGGWQWLSGMWDGVTAQPDLFIDNGSINSGGAGSGDPGYIDDTIPYDVGAYDGSVFWPVRINQLRVAYQALDAGERAEWLARNPPATDSVTGDHAWIARSDDVPSDNGAINDLIGD